jgi:hypothetical protein
VAVLLCFLATGCSASTGANADPCLSARAAAAKHTKSGQTLWDAAKAAARSTSPSPSTGDHLTDSLNALDAQRRAEAAVNAPPVAAVLQFRLGAQVIVGNAKCFTVERRAQAQEYLDTTPR